MLINCGKNYVAAYNKANTTFRSTYTVYEYRPIYKILNQYQVIRIYQVTSRVLNSQGFQKIIRCNSSLNHHIIILKKIIQNTLSL